MSINEIAKLIGVNRLSVSKYITVLLAREVVVLSRSVGKAKMFELSPDYAKIVTATTPQKEKRMVKVEFLKDYLHYRRGVTALLEEDEARELIKTHYARELTT